MRSKGSRFTLGVIYVRNRSQPSATVPNRPPCFVTCRNWFCVASAILLRPFQKMRCSFRGRRSTLDVPIVILRGRRTTSDVSCCVFFANRNGRAASSGDRVQIPWQAWQAWHFVMKIDGSLARNIDFEVANLEVPKKTRRKTSILKLQSFTLLTPHPTLYTLHTALHTLHFTLYTLHSTLYTVHFSLHTLHSTLHTPHFTLRTLHFTLHPLSHSTVYSALVR